jgi:hypothetical protein
VSSAGISPNDDPSPEELLQAIQEALTNNPRLADMPVEEIARQLVLEGHLEQEPPMALVEDALDSAELSSYFVEDEPGRKEDSMCMCKAGAGESLGARPVTDRVHILRKASFTLAS